MKRRKSRTNVNGSSGRPKSRSLESVDKISVLPDSILGIVLSFLPTKNAVSTAVLSKRWKLVWMMVHNLDLCYEDSMGKQDVRDDMRFVGFVNRVLLLHDAGWLNKFRLVWTPRCIPSHASSWISTAIKRNVQELFVCVETRVETLEMPISIFNCNLLQSVELKGDIFVSTASVVCLPRLESLKLVSVLFQSEEAFEKLVSRCPKLTYLHVHTDFLYEKDDFMYIISSTSLKRLVVCFDQYQCGLKLIAPSLEYLEIIEHIFQIFVQKCLSSLVEANLRIYLVEDDFYTHSIIEVIRAFDCVKALTLSSDIMWALGYAKFFLSTKLKRLVKFEATICCSCSCISLHDLMEHAECLEVLTINQEVTCMHENNDDHAEWTTPVEVPRCLSSCLKTVIIEGYHGFDDEREMIGYILKHGSVVELMKISCDMFLRDSARLELVQEICKFPRKSPVCAVEFFRSDYPCMADFFRRRLMTSTDIFVATTYRIVICLKNGFDNLHLRMQM